MSCICSHCGYASVIDVLVPNEVWEAICEGNYSLCPNCINDRMVARGLSSECVAVCHALALRTRMTPELSAVLRAWRASPHEIGASIGNPQMNRLF